MSRVTNSTPTWYKWHVIVQDIHNFAVQALHNVHIFRATNHTCNKRVFSNN